MKITETADIETPAVHMSTTRNSNGGSCQEDEEDDGELVEIFPEYEASLEAVVRQMSLIKLDLVSITGIIASLPAGSVLTKGLKASSDLLRESFDRCKERKLQLLDEEPLKAIVAEASPKVDDLAPVKAAKDISVGSKDSDGVVHSSTENSGESVVTVHESKPGPKEEKPGIALPSVGQGEKEPESISSMVVDIPPADCPKSVLKSVTFDASVVNQLALKIAREKGKTLSGNCMLLYFCYTTLHDGVLCRER